MRLAHCPAAFAFLLSLAGLPHSALAQTAAAPPASSPAKGLSKDETQARVKRLSDAAELIKQRSFDNALKEIDALIALSEADPREPDQRVFCGSSLPETVYYLSQAANEKRNAVVASSTWCDALYLRGYVLIEMYQPAAALAPLERAVELSPANSQYLSELAQLLARMRQLDRALTLFKTAEDSAGIALPEAKTTQKARALRGQGYVLIEMKRLDDAEAAYKAALALEPGNATAKGQLQYIESRRRFMPATKP